MAATVTRGLASCARRARARRWAALALCVACGCQAAEPAAPAAPAAPVAAQCPAPAPISDAEVVRRFYELWTDLKAPTVWKNTWFGVSTLQNPFDVWITQEILWEVKPDVVIETGTYHGGSALLWATVLEQISADAKVLSIDVEDHTAEASKHPLFGRRVQFLLGSSIDPKLLADVAERVKGKRVLVILDSLHTRDHVLAELQAFAPLVSVGSYLIVQDAFVNGHPAMPDYGPGPYEAIQAFDPVSHGFEVDHGRERLMFTYNVGGFLKRVR
jgi:cephalosporin hydroxylase